jgi:hypothetical protein
MKDNNLVQLFVIMCVCVALVLLSMFSYWAGKSDTIHNLKIERNNPTQDSVYCYAQQIVVKNSVQAHIIIDKKWVSTRENTGGIWRYLILNREGEKRWVNEHEIVNVPKQMAPPNIQIPIPSMPNPFMTPKQDMLLETDLGNKGNTI